MAAILWLKLKRMRADVPLYIVMAFMALLLSFIFGRAMFDGRQRVVIVDADGSAFSEAFIQALAGDTYDFVHANEQEAQKAVEKAQAIAAIILPEGFGSQTEQARLTLLRTADSPDVMALENAVHAAYRTAAHPQRLHAALETTLQKADLAAPTLETVQQAVENRTEKAAVTALYTVAQTGNFDETYANNIHFLMGFNIFFVMFSIVFTMGGLLEDKRLRTEGRIRITPVSSAAVLAGHFVPAYLIGLAQMAIVLIVGQMLFGLGLGAGLLPVFAVFAAFVLAVVCLGLLLATVLRTLDQMGAVTPVVIVATSMLGGCMWPLSIVGPELRAVANALPQKWALEAAENIVVYGAGLGDVMLSIGVLVAMAVVLFAASVVIYNKKQRA